MASTAAMNGKGSKFLNSFWDLASDEPRARLQATKRIIMHVNEMQKKSEDETVLTADGEYAFQRLVRGLSSSRDSARQGFSACLCQFLVTFSFVEVSAVTQMINDNTRISCNMRGAEERDLMFGKLFGYLALIRSGKLVGDNDNIIKTLDTLIELHQRKAWIREVISESILFLLQQFDFDSATFDTDSAFRIVSKLNEILPTTKNYDIADVPAHLLVLLSGLQDFEATVHASCEEDICSAFSSLALPRDTIITADTFKTLSPTLLAACSGFPKIHRVWYTVLSSIFGINPEERQLPTERVDSTSISSSQEALLIAFVSFIDDNLVHHGASHEKRGVFLKLITELLRLTPSNLIPLVLTKSMVRCLVSIRINKKHTLYALAGVTLSALVSSSVSSSSSSSSSADAQASLAIANTLVQYEGAMFDAKTNSSTVKDLLSGLDAPMVLSYVRTLATVIARTVTTTSTTTAAATSEDDDDEEEEGGGADQAISAILALSAIVKNPRMQERGNLAAVIVAILVRVACFTPSGSTPSCVWEAVVTKKNSKKSKKSSSVISDNIFTALHMSEDRELIDSMIEMVQVIESFASSSSSVAAADAVIEQLVATARSSLLNVLADVGHVSVDHLNQSLSLMENGKSDNNNNNSNNSNNKKRSDSLTGGSGTEKCSSLLHYALVLFLYMNETAGLVLIADEREGDGGDDDEEMEGRMCARKVKVSLQSLCGQLELSNNTSNSNITSNSNSKEKKKKNTSESGSGNENVPNARLVHSCMTFLGQSVFHVVCSEEVDQECLEVIAEVIPAVAQSTSVKSNNDKSLQLKEEPEDDDEEGEEEGEEGFQTALFEACMDLVAVSDKHPVKGVRDATKRLWTSVVQYCLVESSVIEAILMCVVGDDVETEPDADSHKENGHEDGHEDDDEDEEEEEEEVEEEVSTKKLAKKGKQSKKKTVKGTNDDENDDEEEEDIMLDEESTMKLLEGSDDDDDDDDDDKSVDDSDDDDDIDEDGMDAALANMIQMRKQNRKQSMLQAKRQELIIRSRAIDILEVFIHRNEDTSILLPMFYPLLYCLKKITNSSIVQSLQEGRTFEQRMRSVIENKLCKAKFSISVEGEEEVGVFLESTSELLVFLSKCLRSASAPMRITATNCFLCVCRGVVSGRMDGMLSFLSSSFQSLLVEYFNKKNCHVPVKIVDEVFNRFPDFAIPATLGDILQATEGAPSLFLRTDAFRLLSVVLKKHSSLAETSKSLLVSQVNDLISCTVTAIQAKEDMKAKRMKAILQFAKELAQFIKTSVVGGSGTVEQTSVDTFMTALSSSSEDDNNNKHKGMRDQITDILSSIPADSLVGTVAVLAPKSNKKQKGKKKTTRDNDNDDHAPGSVSAKKSSKKKRSSAEVEDDDNDFVDYERDMINKMAAEARKHMPVDNNDDDEGGKGKVKTAKSKGGNKKQKSKK